MNVAGLPYTFTAFSMRLLLLKFWELLPLAFLPPLFSPAAIIPIFSPQE